jgi:hypothetical protein
VPPNDKTIKKDDIHVSILERAKKLSKSRSKVFDENYLKANETSVLNEIKSLGLFRDDMQEEETERGKHRAELLKLLLEGKAEQFLQSQRQFLRFTLLNSTLHSVDKFHELPDTKTLDIFESTASAHLKKSEVPIPQVTRKQFDSRMSGLIKAGLVKRQRGRYLLTAFGKVTYSIQMNVYWKLKALDSLNVSSVELDKIVSLLIEDQEIRSIVMDEEPLLAS